jgi:hypothetical protein
MSTYIDFRAVVEKSLVVNPESNFYFLLDHGGLSGLHQQLRKSSVEWVSLFDCTKETSALAAAPILILTASGGQLRMSRSLLEWIGKSGTYTSTIIMLLSPLHIEYMRARLAARLDVRLSENMTAMLRFFDPRVFEGLTTVLSIEQAKEFFSPAEEWRYLNREGKIAGMKSAFSTDEILSGPLMLSQKQEFTLLEACETDQVLDLLRSNLPRLMGKFSLPDQYLFVSRQIIVAKENQLDSVLQFSLYTAIVLSEGEKVIEDARWPRIIAKLKEGDCDFSEILHE